jgi:hypothetical protein
VHPCEGCYVLHDCMKWMYAEGRLEAEPLFILLSYGRYDRTIRVDALHMDKLVPGTGTYLRGVFEMCVSVHLRGPLRGPLRGHLGSSGCPRL